jgi:hypothetical protein
VAAGSMVGAADSICDARQGAIDAADASWTIGCQEGGFVPHAAGRTNEPGPISGPAGLGRRGRAGRCHPKARAGAESAGPGAS